MIANLPLHILIRVFPGHTLFKANGYVLRGCNSSNTICFVSIDNGGQLLKEIICSNGSKFFPLRVDPFYGGSSSRKSILKSQKFSPFDKNDSKHAGVPIHFRIFHGGELELQPVKWLLRIIESHTSEIILCFQVAYPVP